jgi:hypothetical protein
VSTSGLVPALATFAEARMANLRRSSSVRPAVSGAPQGVGWDWNSCGYSTPQEQLELGKRLNC